MARKKQTTLTDDYPDEFRLKNEAEARQIWSDGMMKAHKLIRTWADQTDDYLAWYTQPGAPGTDFAITPEHVRYMIEQLQRVLRVTFGERTPPAAIAATPAGVNSGSTEKEYKMKDIKEVAPTQEKALNQSRVAGWRSGRKWGGMCLDLARHGGKVIGEYHASILSPGGGEEHDAAVQRCGDMFLLGFCASVMAELDEKLDRGNSDEDLAEHLVNLADLFDLAGEYALSQDRRIERRHAKRSHMEEVLEIDDANLTSAIRANDRLHAEYNQLAPHWKPDMTKEDAVAARIAAIDDEEDDDAA